MVSAEFVYFRTQCALGFVGLKFGLTCFGLGFKFVLCSLGLLNGWDGQVYF